ncbi:hypothetical protein B0T26DRAFT_650721 [Lasiosphaeria miniovina]|uniref:Uncharacterized protein n=1 Tax=Lasiosphaeria miniovina TaxID=1954250 RepID=A0AA40DU36_9PEZI|nr:uncharacterized protein B0T26DRAFT_650721 [Lasiosphaeria miniovina]KAK0713361.1 hypothetical protein B0T26DRAFT_650721 [Lasiosphaeria miniovina]
MGKGLLFWDNNDGGGILSEKRNTLNYGSNTLNYGSTTLPGPVTPPNPTAARRSLTRTTNDGPPFIDLKIAGSKTPTPSSPFCVSPMSPLFPRSPSPTKSNNPRSSQDSLGGVSISSQDSLGGVSIASSGVMSPSLMSWPVPPSTANSVRSSPPPTGVSERQPEKRPPRYQPMPPPSRPARPSNWKKPAEWGT